MKRFTETKKWDDPWFMELSPTAKLLWVWLLDHCDNAGVIEINTKLSSFQIGQPIEDRHISELSSRIKSIENGKIWIEKFIQFQYGTLSTTSRPHVSVLSLIQHHGIKMDQNRIMIQHHDPKSGSNRDYVEGIYTLQEKDKVRTSTGQEEGMQGEEEDQPVTVQKNDTQDFLKFWSSYPRKVGKGKAVKAFSKAIKQTDIETMLSAITLQSEGDAWRKDGGQFIPHPATWLNGERWLDEITIKPNAITSATDLTCGGRVIP